MTVVCYKNETLFPKPHLDVEGQKPEKYNQELIEITDKILLKKIKNEFNINYVDNDDIQPLICGTIVNGSFTRKLRMMRADLFSLLAVSHSAEFISNHKQTTAIKKGVI